MALYAWNIQTTPPRKIELWKNTIANGWILWNMPFMVYSEFCLDRLQYLPHLFNSNDTPMESVYTQLMGLCDWKGISGCPHWFSFACSTSNHVLPPLIILRLLHLQPRHPDCTLYINIITTFLVGKLEWTRWCPVRCCENMLLKIY
jgi:hypothetical protein